MTPSLPSPHITDFPDLTSARPVERSHAAIETFLSEGLHTQVQQRVEHLASLPDVEKVAVMPDVHMGQMFLNGVVLATKELLYPGAVGQDIGCGISAIKLDLDPSSLEDKETAYAVLAMLQEQVPALKHRSQELPALPKDVLENMLSHSSLTKLLKRDGTFQFGTLGRGNHFVEFQRGSDGHTWLMVHSGSRAMGKAIYDTHIAGQSSATPYLEAASDKGQMYLNDMKWAVSYATYNRVQIIRNILQTLKVKPAGTEIIDSPHNTLQQETHDGEQLWVHRKSANSAKEGEIGIIAGSMADPSYIVEGRGNLESLTSSSHGAGRVMSRTEARAKLSAKDLKRRTQNVHTDPKKLSRLTDEAPQAYRNIRDVIRAQKKLIKRVAELTPLINFKHS